MNGFSRILTGTGELVLGLTQGMLKGIDPAKAATRIRGERGPVDAVHPVFILGHLAIYPEKALKMCFDLEPGAAAAPAKYHELFEAGKPCLDDPDCRIYPALADVSRIYFEAHQNLLRVIAESGDDVYSEPNPSEGSLRESFPTKGGMMMFMISAHTMMHLGQLSTWRRCFGLGSVL